MKVYRIKHKPSGLYYSGYENNEDNTGKIFNNKKVALMEFHLWVNMKFACGTELSDWELEENEIKD